MLKAIADHEGGAELKKEVEEAIEEFNGWFQNKLQNERLSMPERAIIDTFCFWLVTVRAKEKGLASLSPPST